MTDSILRWEEIPWRKVEVKVFRLQKQIYAASRCGDVRKVRQLQKLLMVSWSAKALAVRRVTQDNQGKKTAGVDGVKSLTPHQRFELISNLKINKRAAPTRRVWIPKPGKDQMRPLGIPTMIDRGKQALIKLALEPEWEARFEPSSYGFRPGRCCQDAIQHIKDAIKMKAKYVLDADISQCFDRINHSQLLNKLNIKGKVRQQIKAWLSSGVLDKGVFEPTKQGTPQGSVISPLLANIALDGLEQVLKQYATTLKLRYPSGKSMPTRDKIRSLTYIRYADDFIVLHQEPSVLKKCRQIITEWLATWGLELNPKKTRNGHTLDASLSEDGKAGFNFLGFNIRQYPRGKHQSDLNSKREILGFDTLIIPSSKALQTHYRKMSDLIDNYKNRSQLSLIKKLNPIIIGWRNYYKYSDAKTSGTFSKLDWLLSGKLRSWGRRKCGSLKNAYRKYWTTIGDDNWVFAAKNGTNDPFRLLKHIEVESSSIKYVKVKGDASPYNGQATYWSTRKGEYPGTPTRHASLLKRQGGKCQLCGLYFREEDLMEIDHIIPKAIGGKDTYKNRQLLHRHCHDVKTKDDILLINQYEHCKFLKRLHQEWEKVDYIWSNDYPIILRKSR